MKTASQINFLSREIEISDWLRAAATNPSFDFLNEEAEDIYARTDGKPFERSNRTDQKST